MDNGENMEHVRYAMNDDTAGFINQMKNRNTGRKTEHDLKSEINQELLRFHWRDSEH